MEDRKRSYCKRRYSHNCPAHGNREQQISKEICPECGQRGEFCGFYRGMFHRMSQRSQLLGFPVSGIHQTFLPKMIRSCERCQDEGIVRGDDFDYECPDCNGTGGFLIHNEEEMRKIRRWALARHDREIAEKHANQEAVEPLPNPLPANPIPGNPIFTRDIDVFVKGMMAIHNYNLKYGERNKSIGELVLPCDDHGWDVFMEMVETWDNSGRGLGVSQDAVLLKASPRKNAATLISIYPPLDQLPQRMLVNRQKIRRVFGRQVELEFWRRIGKISLTIESWISVDEHFNMSDVRDLILLFNKKV